MLIFKLMLHILRCENSWLSQFSASECKVARCRLLYLAMRWCSFLYMPTFVSGNDMMLFLLYCCLLYRQWHDALSSILLSLKLGNGKPNSLSIDLEPQQNSNKRPVEKRKYEKDKQLTESVFWMIRLFTFLF